MKLLNTFLFWMLLVGISKGQNNKKLLLIGIDGCRSDALIAASTPNLDSLINTGTYSMDARTVHPTVSGPGWSSMLTGVWYTKHGILNNTFIPTNLFQYPHFFNRIKQVNSSLRTASISQWSPINIFIANQADYTNSTSNGVNTRDRAIDELSSTNQDADVVFVHFDDVDHAGHASGFTPSNPSYISAIEGVDNYIGAVLSTLRNRPNYSNEDWLILVSTDHGGINTDHGGPTQIERKIFSIMNGGGLAAQELTPTTSSIPSNAVLNTTGGNEYAYAPHNSAFDFGSNTDFTIECRVKTTGWSGDPSIVSNKNWNSGLSDGFIIAGNNDGATWKVNLGDGLFNRVDIDGGPINDGLWHHLAVSVDRDGEMRIFQDGRLIGINNVNNIGNINNSNPIGIGQDGTLSYSDGFNGQIDEVRVWRSIVHDSTIAQWGGQSIDNTHPNYSDLAGYWKLDEGTGNSSVDASSTGSDLVFSGATWATASNMTYTNYYALPHMVDLVPTALEHLCIPIDPSWGIQGRSFVTCNTTSNTSVVQTPIPDAALSVHPNPASYQITVSFPEFLTEAYTLEIIDAQGKLIQSFTDNTGYMTSLNIYNLPVGLYLVRLRTKNYEKTAFFVRQ